MKKSLIILVLFIATLLFSSCDTGCGCPGGAGYGEIETTTMNNQHT